MSKKTSNVYVCMERARDRGYILFKNSRPVTSMYFTTFIADMYHSDINYCKLFSIHLFDGIQDGFTPLYMASQGGHTSVVDILLRHGADPNLATTVSVEIVSTSYHRV